MEGGHVLSWGVPVLPPTSSPRAALGDLFGFLRQRSREQVIGALLAILSTIIIIILFLVDPQINTAPPEQIVYVENFKPGRTDADIKADQVKDQKLRDALKAERKRQFKQLEKTLGM